jgi:hypothetical protein
MNRLPGIALALALFLACAPFPAAASDIVPDSLLAPAGGADTDSLMRFTPEPGSAAFGRAGEPMHVRVNRNGAGGWRRAPFGDEMLTHPDPWRARHPNGGADGDVLLDYNRVDLLRYGAWVQAQRPETMNPRLGGRLEYATGRRRVLYGLQVEQPLLPTARFVLGLGMVRRTDHGDLQQIEDAENSLMLLAAHEDWRDYFEREGAGAYLSWRVPDFSTVSVHLRSDRYRSLVSSTHVHSWWHLDRPLRDNPSIDDGDAHSVFVRLERLAHRRHRSRSGLYHWIELERAGGPTLRGDFDYTRALADLRSVVRVLPATTLTLRVVGGSALEGTLPRQREFVIGGVDGLRAHTFGAFRGDRVALGQAEYSIGLHAFGGRARVRGPRALLFLDSGTAWYRAVHGELSQQHFALDGGAGLATPDDDLRITFAKNLQDPESKFVVALRLNRPF